MKPKKERLVVIGNGMAGNACIEEIIKLDPGRYDITLFGRERHLNYNRVLLSNIVAGEKRLEEIIIHEKDWYERNGIRLFTACPVMEIKRASKTVKAEGMEAHYDRLIITTGSVPVMPAIPGIEKEGVVSFRDIDDCEKIRSFSKGGGKAVVIGGGLLGLEAAKGLMSLGMEVTVVHLMDRLMEKQLDETASGFLQEEMEKLGIRFLLGKQACEIAGGKAAEEVRFADNTAIQAGLVVVSIGIRPEVSLAKESGLYCEKGVVVNDCMQTYDPAVFAAGECVEHRGKTFGLVAPLFEQAKVIASHLAGDSRLTFRDRPVSTRLKVPGIELYSGGEISQGPGVETIEYLDRAARIYKKVFLKEGKLKGMILYGDTADGARLFSSILGEENISERRHSLLLGDPQVSRATGGGTAMPDDAIVCGCSGVTRGMIAEAIVKKGLFTREDIKRETKASSSCGGCAPLIDRILEEVLGTSFDGKGAGALCACTGYTRDDVIKNIREKKLTSVSQVMDTLGWETVGCEKCRPAINYYVSMVWPAEAEDDQTSRLVNERAHANIQKDGAFSVVPRMAGGAVTPSELKRIAEAAEKYRVPLLKMTGGQRIDLLGVKKEDLPSIWKELAMESGYAYAKALRTVKACVGDRFCRYGTQDSLGFGQELENMLKGLWTPAKLKLGVSGCPRNCAEPLIKDVGVIGVAGGWDIFVGGCGGIELKGAKRLCSAKTKTEAMDVIGAFIQLYREDAEYGERTYKWVRKIGMETIKAKVVDDKAARGELNSRLEMALGAHKDPWMERIPSGAIAS